MQSNFYKSINPIDLYVNDQWSGHDMNINFPKTWAYPNNTQEVGNSIWKVFSNKYGCYDNPFELKELSNFGILIGDSQTQGIEKFEHTWGYYLEKKTNIKFLKCGVSGFGPIQSLVKLEKLITQTSKLPNYVIYNYSANDFIDDLLFPNISIVEKRMVDNNIIDLKNGNAFKVNTLTSKRAIKSQLQKCDQYIFYKNLLCSLFNKTIIANMIKQRLKSYKLDKFFNLNFDKNLEVAFDEKRKLVEKQNQKILKDKLVNYLSYYSFDEFEWLEKKLYSHLQNIVKIKNKANLIGAKFYVVYIPEKFEIYPHLLDSFWAYQSIDESSIEKRRNIIFNYFKKNNIILIDPTDNLLKSAEQNPKKFYNEEQLYWAYDGHLRKKGNYIIANTIKEKIASF